MILNIKPQNFGLLSEQELESKMNSMSVEFANERYPYKILVLPKIVDITETIREQEDLKQKIQYLEDEQKEVAQYRGGAQQHVLDRYNWDLIVEQMLEIYQGNLIHYEEVLERHRRREGQWSKNERLE